MKDADFRPKIARLPDEQKDIICDNCEKCDVCHNAYTHLFLYQICQDVYEEIKEELEGEEVEE